MTLDGPGGTEISSTLSDPWLRGPTATRTRNDITTNAWMTQLVTSRTRTALAAGGCRIDKTTKTFNDDGLVTSEDDFGDEDATGDEVCTRTTYARNPTTGMVDRVSQSEKLSGACAAAGTTANPGILLTRTRNVYGTYDGPSPPTSPTPTF